MFRKVHNFLLFTLLSAGLIACSNDFEILAPHRDLPLVYSLLDPVDSVHYVRIEKTFAGEANALEMASVIDSLYYKNVQVQIERWRDRSFAESFTLDEIENIPKDTGLFAHSENQLFQLHQVIDPLSEYKLIVEIDDIGLTLESNTRIVSGVKLIKPGFNQPRFSFANLDLNTEVEWLTTQNSRLYFLQFHLQYLEITEHHDTVSKMADWTIGHFISEHRDGGQRMETMIPNRRFFQWMASKIPPADANQKRIIPLECLDISFTIGGEELYTYLEINQGEHNPMISQPVYTNINNGIGLFSSRTTQKISGKGLTYATIDSVSHGQYTSQLGFADSTDDYYSR